MSKKIEKELAKEQKALQKEENKRLYKSYCEMHNKAPVSRRDFLNAGIISFSASMTLPSIAGLLLSPQRAFAAEQECPKPGAAGGNRMSAFVTLNLSGGASLSANYVPMDAGGQPLPSYNKMGLGDGQVPIDREFGNAPFAGQGISKLLTQLRTTANAATLAKTAFIAIPLRSRDDSNENKMDASGMVSKAGLIGSTLPNLGSRDSDTGVSQQFAKVKPPNPLRVSRFTDIDGALGGGTNALSVLNTNQKVSFYNLIKTLSESQVQKVMNDSGGSLLSNLVKCAAGQNVDLASKPKPGVDARQNAGVAGVWGINANSNVGDQSVVFSSMVLAGLMGEAGTVALEMGGYDYHDNSRTSGDNRDGQAGAVIGRILQTASVINQKVFIYVTSDGSCSSAVSDDRAAPWTSDRGSAGVVFIFAFDPAGRPATSGFQIGQFTTEQVADDRFVTGGNAELAAAAAFANYLKFNGKMALLESVIPGVFSAAQLSQIIKFT